MTYFNTAGMTPEAPDKETGRERRPSVDRPPLSGTSDELAVGRRSDDAASGSVDLVDGDGLQSRKGSVQQPDQSDRRERTHVAAQEVDTGEGGLFPGRHR
jgi:hypothetical protein